MTNVESPAGEQPAPGLRQKALRRRVIQALVGLSGVLAVAWLIDARYFLRAFRSQEAAAAGAAAIVCWLSSGMALGVTFLGVLGNRAIAGALGGILFRTGLPLVAMAVGSQIPWLAGNGFSGRVVAYFLVSLAAETILAVWVAKSSWNIRFWR